MKKNEQFISEHPQVEAWLRNRPAATRRKFAGNLLRFCEAMGIEPEEWRNLDKLQARDLAWNYIEPNIRDHPSVATSVLTTLKSWYRNKDGEVLPFDSGRGGKHHIPQRHPKRSIEHVPSKNEVYQLVDMTSNLRDRALLLFLFQSGCRSNVARHITYGDVKSQLDEPVITLKIDGRLDNKLRSSNIDYYITFLGYEAGECLTQYCRMQHADSNDDTPLFVTRYRKPLSQMWIWKIVKLCAKRAGMDSRTIWPHSLRKAFRKVVRQTPSLDDDDREQLMGHQFAGSRQYYYDKKDVELIKAAYLKCDFSREIQNNNHIKMKNEIERLQAQNVTLTQRLDLLETLLQQYIHTQANAEG